jgi:hypothetical protein
MAFLLEKQKRLDCFAYTQFALFRDKECSKTSQQG